MTYQQFIDKITDSVMSVEYVGKTYMYLDIHYEGWNLKANFDTKYFVINSENYDSGEFDYIVGWNVFELDYINVTFQTIDDYSDSDSDSEPVYRDDMSCDEFFNATLVGEVRITYDQYKELGNIYLRLKELYV